MLCPTHKPFNLMKQMPLSFPLNDGLVSLDYWMVSDEGKIGKDSGYSTES